jgi:Fe-S oxidoreductase
MQGEIEAGLPVVVLEPSCASVFRDELTNLFPTRKDAQHLASHTFLLSEFLAKHAPDYQPPRLSREAIVHGHCHHKSIMKMDDEKELLKKMGVKFRQPEEGCCGMAGAFGYEEGEHYEVGLRVGEKALLPAVREAREEELIIADGFSCREQVHQETDRHAMHLAEVMQMAIRHGEGGVPGRPERELVERRDRSQRRSKAKALAVVGAAALVGVGTWMMLRERRRGGREVGMRRSSCDRRC